ncbi:cob(I)yrinic acid a,c-diamide adenosyltransferase [Marinospirillum alkaliphilum]|uniref:Corrinoid adenosyltransferase n=1 Tax=Marinospirillum alkaliphilum DSM 21637 TaxID=1122209 RepID=A0A1K1XJH4_9GAMM|nr:cob(I)yrinic acid a,c-diamide adenosyltransferase [Marinospirillum alkaliphilum]SFX49833.1 cob(I)yrinic acid a,c-diamide adenosyltransferase [Marinospirillum alkaliphilum DSM 21637]
MTDTDKSQRHKQRMERHKAVVDEKIASATSERGVVVVHTGNGKGKSTAAFGMAARALGHGMKVGIVQFIKGSFSTGEEAFFRRFPDVSYHVMGQGYTWETQNLEQDKATAARGWAQAKAFLEDPSVDLVVLDELNIALKYQYIDMQAVLDALAQRPAMQHVVITGRGARDELIAVADTVSEHREIKHAFHAGVMAQKGVEL